MFAHSKYAFKNTIRFIPFFYQSLIALNFLKLQRNFEQDRENIIKYIEELKEQEYPIWFVFFCEGTRFTHQKAILSQKFSKENNLECLKNVLIPRYKGFCMIQDLLKDSYINKVLDLTFYSDNYSFSTQKIFFSGEVFNIKCDARLIEMNSIEDNKKFLFDAFKRKDELIEGWKQKIKQD
ncbi:hypothetical protein GINT2_002344 [Glugoides intestinalis]